MLSNDYLILIFNAVFYGFCFTSLLSYFFSLSKSENIKAINNNFFNQSIKFIRIVGIIYLIYTISYYIYYLNFIISEDDYLSSKNRATGPYAWAYWIMILRSLIFSSLTQLFWLKKFKNKGFSNFILTFFIFIILLFSGVFIERFIIIITSFHRDYLPSSWKLLDEPNNLWYFIPLALLTFFVVRVTIYLLLIVMTQFISKKITNKDTVKQNHS